MGMFDDIKCERQMPDGYRNHYGYQSKDLDCTLDQYTVTSEGRLIRTYCADGNSRPLGDINYEGTLNIYASAGWQLNWHEYDLIFENGSLVRIEPVACIRRKQMTHLREALIENRRMTAVKHMHDMVDKTSLWDALRALEQVCLDMAGEEKLAGPYEIAEKLRELQHLAFAYKL